MQVAVDNVNCEVLSATPEELQWLESYLSVEHTTYRRSRPQKGKPVGVEAKTEFVSVLQDQRLFPTGLLRMVQKRARTTGSELNVVDHRKVPCKVDLGADTTWLRDHQVDAINSVVRANGRGIVKASTGAGKTEIPIALSRMYNCEWLMLADSADLTQQAAERFEKRTGERAGVWGGWKEGWRKGTANFSVATFQAIHRALQDFKKGKDAPKGRPHLRDLLTSIQGLCIDEVHVQAAESYYSVTQHFGEAYYRIGLSATPLDGARLSGLYTLGALGPIVHEVPRQTLVDLKLLSEATVHMIPCKQGASKSGTDWRQVYEWWVVKSDVRNRTLTEMVVQAAKPALLFADEHAHIEELAAMCRARQLKVDTATGETWQDQRREKLDALERNEVDVLIANVVFQKGIDVPKLRSVINGAGKQSAISVLQRIGRGMRADEESGKYTFEVWDILDQGQRWLAGHAQERLAIYQREGHKVLLGWEGIELEPPDGK